MNRVSRDMEKRVLELYFSGIQRDSIAKTVGDSTGNVSEIVGILPANLKPLRDLSVTLRKNNLTVPETRQAVGIVEDLKTLGLKPEQFSASILAIKKMWEDSTYQPDKLVKAAIQLLRLEA